MSNRSPVIQTQSLKKTFGSVTAVDGIDVKIYPNEVTCIIGPNGAGKTTFSKLITGSLDSTNGSIYFYGDEITNHRENERVQKGVVRSFQKPALYSELTTFENIRTAALINKKRGVEFVIPSREKESVKISNDILNSFKINEYKEEKVKNIPHGTKKIVDIAMSFATNPELVILDEPTSGVGTAEKTELMRTIINASNDQNITLLVIEHDMEIVREQADRVIAMHNGKIIEDDKPNIVLQSQDVTEKILSEGF
jgi:branched-chain amino acid transport system ATP-binding protein